MRDSQRSQASASPAFFATHPCQASALQANSLQLRRPQRLQSAWKLHATCAIVMSTGALYAACERSSDCIHFCLHMHLHEPLCCAQGLHH